MARSNPEECLALANGQVAAAQALRDDLLSVLFPCRGTLPSEYIQSQIRYKLQLIVRGIEATLLAEKQEHSHSWDILADSGLLREPAFIAFALSRLAEDQLLQNLQSATNALALEQLPVRLLGHKNQRIADMARQLLLAAQIAADDDWKLYQRMANSDQHMLCWRVVAALQDSHIADAEQLVANANALLSSVDSCSNPVAIARKLVFFLEPEYRAELLDPRIAGLYLYVAQMEQNFRLDADFLFQMMNDDQGVPLLLLLKGQSISVGQLALYWSALRSGAGKILPPDLMEAYDALDVIEVRQAVSNWASEAPK